jgi:hypothetical protein
MYTQLWFGQGEISQKYLDCHLASKAVLEAAGHSVEIRKFPFSGSPKGATVEKDKYLLQLLKDEPLTRYFDLDLELKSVFEPPESGVFYMDLGWHVSYIIGNGDAAFCLNRYNDYLAYSRPLSYGFCNDIFRRKGAGVIPKNTFVHHMFLYNQRS